MIIDRVSAPNVVDFLSYQRARDAVGKAQAIAARSCRHCGAGLMDGESDDDCSSLGVDAALPARRFRAE